MWQPIDELNCKQIGLPFGAFQLNVRNHVNSLTGTAREFAAGLGDTDCDVPDDGNAGVIPL